MNCNNQVSNANKNQNDNNSRNNPTQYREQCQHRVSKMRMSIPRYLVLQLPGESEQKQKWQPTLFKMEPPTKCQHCMFANLINTTSISIPLYIILQLPGQWKQKQKWQGKQPLKGQYHNFAKALCLVSTTSLSTQSQLSRGTTKTKMTTSLKTSQRQ